MKLILVTAFCFCYVVAYPTNYYFSSTSGDDSRTSIQAQNPATPWKTLVKLNSFFSSLNPGDSVLLKRDDVFLGKINISRSGASGLPLIISAYGIGNNPVITGLITVNSWTNVGNNIWESTDAVSNKTYTNLVLVNGINTPMGRYPNTGYLTYQSHVGNTSITSSSLSGTPNWTGAEAVIRKERWIIDRNPIVSQSGSTLNYTPATVYNGKNGYGFFIQNDIKTLDSQNEWFYNPSTKKISIYSTSAPTNVQVPTFDTLVNIFGKNHITFDNISFIGSNKQIFLIAASANINIKYCKIEFSYDGIKAENTATFCPNFQLENSVINHINNKGCYITNEFPNAIVRNNIFKNSGMIPGMGGSGDGTYIALMSEGAPNSFFEYNLIDSTGYNGFYFVGMNSLVNKNFVTNYCLIKDDGGGIYTYSSNYTGSVISNNIVVNGPGNWEGTYNSPGTSEAFGIYLDGYTDNLEVTNNTVANNGYSGIFLHIASNIKVRGNTCYDNKLSSILVKDETGSTSVNMEIKNNIFFVKEALPFSLQWAANKNNFGIIDSNYYARPLDDNQTFINESNSGTYHLQGWRAFFGQDANSKKSPKTISNVNELRFEYNETSSTKIISLDANYIDVKNVSYNGTITLLPYTSAVLIRNGPATSNQTPNANAGTNQNITLPTNSLTLTGSGTDPDGTITAYQWTKIAGPASFTIVSPTQASTVINSLVQGVYQFELRVTDNSGAFGRDTVVVTVNAAIPNQAPTANAGTNQNITLPTNSLTLTGSGTDPDGTITAYQWSKIAGPASFTIVSPAQASTVINSLVQGVYQFVLRVTDNSGAFGRDTVVVTVNSAIANQPPTANAGLNQNITLPTNSLTLNGSGSDPDGTISAYQWTKIAGPASFTIVSPTQASTVINSLVQGVYQFELRVTDNSGAFGRDTVVVTVNAAANQAPTANAGLNQNITLPTNSLTLTGSGTDPDGTITAYQWTKIAGPASFTIVSPTQASTVINSLVQGVYQFELRVTDNSGVFGRDTVIVTINGAANQAPTANAGSDKTITLPTNSLTLNGSGTDPDGTIVSYQWTKISGPASFTIASPSQASTEMNTLIEGVYQFQLEVTDNTGATARDIIVVTVNAARTNNGKPTSKAGTKKTVNLPTTSVILEGSGIDPDGTITEYNWKVVKSPAPSRFSNPRSAITEVSDLTKGIYQFELQVTDNSGEVALDTVEVEVKELLAPAISIYPNPVSGNVLNLKIDALTISSPATIAIYDMSGKILYQESFIRNQSSIIKQINVSHFHSGAYIVKVNSDINNTMSLKMVKQ